MKPTKPQFTPGPWQVDISSVGIANGYEVNAIVSECGGMLAEVYMEHKASRANAALIAAAPEMYALLTQCLDHIGGHDRLAHAVEDILAKARGES